MLLIIFSLHLLGFVYIDLAARSFDVDVTCHVRSDLSFYANER